MTDTDPMARHCEGCDAEPGERCDPFCLSTERVTLDPPTDPHAWRCLCGNVPSAGGFYPCDISGLELEPVKDGPWDGIRYVCADCGRIVNADTLEVIGRATRPTCEWFALCTNPADGTAEAPRDGRMTEVPVCWRCANHVGMTLTPFTESDAGDD